MDNTTDLKVKQEECFRLERAQVDSNYVDMLPTEIFRIVVPDSIEGEST